jgi:hypothetical protein
MENNIKSINIKSVILSGIVAGIVMLISAFTMVPVVGNEMDIALANRGLPPLSNLSMVYFAILSIVNGIFILFLYTLLKPYFVSKTKAALLSSFIFWIISYLFSTLSLIVYGFIPIKLAIMGIAWGLGELILAGLIGSRIYKEKSIII